MMEYWRHASYLKWCGGSRLSKDSMLLNKGVHNQNRTITVWHYPQGRKQPAFVATSRTTLDTKRMEISELHMGIETCVSNHALLCADCRAAGSQTLRKGPI